MSKLTCGEVIVGMMMALPVNIYQIGRYGKESVIRTKITDQGRVVDIFTGDKIETNCATDSKLLLLTRSIGSVALLPITAIITAIGATGVVLTIPIMIPVIIVENVCKTPNS